MSVAMSARANKPARPIGARPAPPSAPLPPQDKSLAIAVWRALANCPFNADAEAIVHLGSQLLQLVEQFVDEHDKSGYVEGLRAAGLAEHVNAHHRHLAANVLSDMAGLAWALDTALGLIGSEVYPAAELPAKPPRRSR